MLQSVPAEAGPAVPLINLWRPGESVTVLASEFFTALVDYRLIVSRWPLVQSGAATEDFDKSFSSRERSLIRRHLSRFRRWVLGDEIPDQIRIHQETFLLLQRAAAFFRSN